VGPSCLETGDAEAEAGKRYASGGGIVMSGVVNFYGGPLLHVAEARKSVFGVACTRLHWLPADQPYRVDNCYTMKFIVRSLKRIFTARRILNRIQQG
jgi:hypothetical protein